MKIPENTLNEVVAKLKYRSTKCLICKDINFNVNPYYVCMPHVNNPSSGHIIITNTCKGCGFIHNYSPEILLGNTPSELKP